MNELPTHESYCRLDKAFGESVVEMDINTLVPRYCDLVDLCRELSRAFDAEDPYAAAGVIGKIKKHVGDERKG